MGPRPSKTMMGMSQESSWFSAGTASKQAEDARRHNEREEDESEGGYLPTNLEIYSQLKTPLYGRRNENFVLVTPAISG